MGGPRWETLIYGMVINDTDLPDGQRIGIISSQSRGAYDSFCISYASLVASMPVLLCNIISFLSFIRDFKISISCQRFLGIAGMTTMLPLSILPWELCRWWCISRVSLVHGVHTHSTAEENVSGTLKVLAINSVTGPTKQRQRDKWISQGCNFKSFLRFCSSFRCQHLLFLFLSSPLFCCSFFLILACRHFPYILFFFYFSAMRSS